MKMDGSYRSESTIVWVELLHFQYICRMKTVVTLESMKFYAFHGVMEEERLTGGTYLADISYTIDAKAVDTDDIRDTISYADVYDLVRDEMLKPSQLIEHLAGRILKVVRDRYPQMQEVTVKISKLTPPVNGETERATVTIKF
jgi:dihydroneopterin aldolase